MLNWLRRRPEAAVGHEDTVGSETPSADDAMDTAAQRAKATAANLDYVAETERLLAEIPAPSGPNVSAEEREMWRARWTAQGLPWRTEPEISAERQAYLTTRRALTADPYTGTYPFGDVWLSRADVEWLLATHDDGKGWVGPVDQADPEQMAQRTGLRLYGADLRGVDLSALPLALTGGTLPNDLIRDMTKKGLDAFMESGTIKLTGANLRGAHLDGSYLANAWMVGADLTGAYLTGASLVGARMWKARLVGADLSGVFLTAVDAQGADFTQATLDLLGFAATNFTDATLVGARFVETKTMRAESPGFAGGLFKTVARRANFSGLDLSGLSMYDVRLEEANFSGANLTNVDFRYASLEGANFRDALLAGARFEYATLTPGSIIEKLIHAGEEQTESVWARRGQPWRRESEIDAERMALLAARRAERADDVMGRYPFGGMALTRADVEWLLATHDDGRGPVDPDDETQRERVGLDLRGADLSGVDLSGLPLAHLRAGARRATFHDNISAEQASGRTLFKKANLAKAQLQRADLVGANFQDATLEWAHFEEANLRQAWLYNIQASWGQFQGANLHGVMARRSTLREARFDGADLGQAQLSGVQASNTSFRDAKLEYARLDGLAICSGAHFERAQMRGVICVDPDALVGSQRLPSQFNGAYLSEATLVDAQMQGVDLRFALLAQADMQGARLEGANLTDANLAGADLRRVTFDDLTLVERMILGNAKRGPALLAGVRWNGVDVAAIDWSRIPVVGDERLASAAGRSGDTRRSLAARLAGYVDAIFANQQLALALDGAGLDELAAPYAYRARTLERSLLWRRILWRGEVWRFGQYLFSAFLGMLTGYGYRLGRILIAYALVIALGAVAFFTLGMVGPDGHAIAPTEAVLLSVTAFHGRVFSAPFTLGLAQQWVAAVEAVIGLLIESVFVAMLTQRFFGK